MNITTNYKSPNFGLSINTSKMNSEQLNLANRIARGIETSQFYEPLDRLELIFLPKAKGSNIIVRVLDLLSGKFLKSENGKTLEMTVKDNEDYFHVDYLELSDTVIDFYKESGNIKRPAFNEKDVLNGKTYLQQKFLPNSVSEIGKTYDACKDFMSQEDAKSYAIAQGYLSNIPVKGFNIDF